MALYPKGEEVTAGRIEEEPWYDDYQGVLEVLTDDHYEDVEKALKACNKYFRTKYRGRSKGWKKPDNERLTRWIENVFENYRANTDDKFQPFCEFWHKFFCPKCKVVNWMYASHSERSYPNVANACECHKCSHKFWCGDRDSMKDEFWTEYGMGVDYVLEELANIDVGYKEPS